MNSIESTDDKLSRGWLRRHLAKKIVYDAGPLHHSESPEDSHVHAYTLKLVGGIHFPMGANSVSDATRPAVAVLSTLINAFKHLEAGGKRDALYGDRTKHAVSLARVPLQWTVVTHQVLVPSVPDPATGTRTLAAVQFHWTVTEVGAVDGGDVPADETDGDEAPAAAAAADGRAAPKKKRAPFNAKLMDHARKAPLAVGFARHFCEVRHMKKQVVVRRAAYVKAHHVKSGQTTADLQSLLRIKTPATVPEYAFAAHSDMESFVLEALQPYFRVPANMQAAIPTYDPGNAFLDFTPGSTDAEQANARVAARLAGTRLDPNDRYVDPMSPLHPDYMFCPERALAYFNCGLDALPDPACTQLDSYYPYARPRPSPPQRRQVPQAAVPDDAAEDVAVIESDDSDDDSDDDGDDASEDAPPAVAPRHAAPATDPYDLRRWIYDSASGQCGRPYTPARNARPAFPFPRLVAVMNTQATYAEITTTIVPLMYAIGAPLPEKAFAPLTDEEMLAPRIALVMPEESPLSLTLALQCAQQLRIAENTLAPSTNPLENEPDTEAETTIIRDRFKGAARHLRTNGVARAANGSIQHVQVQGIEYVDDPTVTLDKLVAREPLLDDADVVTPADREEQGIDAVPPRLLPLMAQQTTVVRTAISTLAAGFRTCEYAELTDVFDTTPVPESSHTFMPPYEFYQPRSSEMREMSQLQIARRHFELLKGKMQLTAAQETNVMSFVDVFPAWVTQRNELLETRPTRQMARGLMVVRHKAEMDSLILANDVANETERLRALARLDARHQRELYEWHTAAWRTFLELWEATLRLSPAVLAVRDYILTHVKPRRHKSAVKPVNFNARSYAVVRQFYVDSYRSGELVTKQNFPYMERAHTCGHHCMRWMPRRADPALNYTIVGQSGSGKSFSLLIMGAMTPDGVVSDTTNETTNSYNVDQDFDGHVVLYQEFDSNLLFPNNKNDAGASDKINFAKARMTSFFTRVKFFKSDEQTGKRTAADCFSSQHIVTLGATNQDVSKMDKNMRRRLLLDNISESPAESEGNHSADMERPQCGVGVDMNVPEQVRNDHRELFCYFSVMEAAIKAGVTEDYVMTDAAAFLTAILGNAAITCGVDNKNKGHRVWVLEVARILAMQDMCYKSLYSPLADQLRQHSGVERWSPEAFSQFSEVFKFVGKEHVIHALTMFDILYSSRAEDELLATIALNVLHIDDPRRWRFRHVDGAGDVREDFNYLSCTGANPTAIGGKIADMHKLVAKIRSEDVRFRLIKHETQQRSTHGFGVPARNADGVFTLMNRYMDGPVLEMPIIIYEKDPTSTNKVPPYQFSVMIEFFEKRFDFNIMTDSSATIRAKIRRALPRLNAELLREPEYIGTVFSQLRDMVVCTQARAPLVSSIMKTLNMPTLEFSPYEHPQLAPLAPEVFRYFTFYQPHDVYVDFDDGSAVRVPVDGATMFITGERDPAGHFLMSENYTKPLPTACASLYNIRPGSTADMETISVEMSRGSIYDKYDPDFFASDAALRRIGHPGIPLFHELYVKALVERRNRDKYPDEASFQRQLFDAIPILDPKSGVVLPFAFPPITHAIEQYLATHVYKWSQLANYPECNLMVRLTDTVKRRDGHTSANANKAYTQKSDVAGFAQRFKIAQMRRTGEIVIDNDDRGNEDAPAAPSTPPPPQQSRRRRRSDNDDGGGSSQEDLTDDAERPRQRKKRRVGPASDDAMDIDKSPAASRLVPPYDVSVDVSSDAESIDFDA